jgi:antitoxin HicB
MARDLPYYLSLDYPVEMFRGEGAFFVHHPDLPGCMSQGDTADEALANLDDAREGWLRVALEAGQPIAEPLGEDEMEYSGHISLRMTPTLHAALAASARRQGVSLNQLINTVLAEYRGLVRSRAEIEGRLAEGRGKTFAAGRKR